jgi:hypothetical protein
MIIIFMIGFQVNVLTEFYELFRLPLLIEHFLEHQEQEGKLSLIDFLHLHYSTEHKNVDSTEHNQLPFKNHQDGFQHPPLNIVFFTEEFAIEFHSFPSSVSHTSSYQAEVSVGKTNGIWQPPQFI